MIDCPRCQRENEEHYKFCLGCGAELPSRTDRPRAFSPPKPSGSMAMGTAFAAATASDSMGSASVAESPSSLEQGSSQTGVPCPVCEAQVPLNFRFCHVCGHDLHPSELPPADGHSADNGTSSPVAPLSPAVFEPVVEAEPEPIAQPALAPVRLVLIRPDGRQGEAFDLQGATTVIGRAAGGVFARDAYLSPEHAEFHFDGAQLVVRDLESLNGIYIRIEAEVPVELFDGSLFRIGQEVLRYEAPTAPDPADDGTQWMGSPNLGILGRIRLVIGRDTYGNSFPIPPHGLHLGRERGDVNFPDDGYVSGLHCRVHSEVGHVFLTDVGSSNGTFVRVRGESFVPNGAYMLLGQQLFRAEY